MKQVFRKPTQAELPSHKDPSTASTNQLAGRALREMEAGFETVEIGYVSPELATRKQGNTVTHRVL